MSADAIDLAKAVPIDCPACGGEHHLQIISGQRIAVFGACDELREMLRQGGALDLSTKGQRPA